MKRTIWLVLALSLLLSLCACGGKEETKAEFDAAALCESLLNSTAFSVPLDELPASKASAFYGVDEESVEEALLWHAAGTSKEQIVLIRAKDQDAAYDMCSQLGVLQAEWIEADTNYAPAEVPKLVDATLRTVGNWVVMVVANEPDTAKEIVEKYA